MRAPAMLAVALAPALAFGAEGIGKVNHIVVLMQENHSFDNYFGVIAYSGPYHSPASSSGCDPDDHLCVDGLSCAPDPSGGLTCFESNLDDDGSLVYPFHATRRCIAPDLDHGWPGTHTELNFAHPAASLGDAPDDGFVRVNDVSEQPDGGVEGPHEDETMAYFDESDLPFYYALAKQFALGDRYFASVPGPTFPNRAYLMAATSFGHLTTGETLPPMGGYRPATGTIFDLLEAHGVTWADYYQSVPQGFSFRPFFGTARDPHFLPLPRFLRQAAGARNLPPLPQVVFVDPSFGPTALFPRENDEHPPTDIQRGQAFVSRVVNALRRGPYWKDTIILITWDEHGGFYDHVAPPQAPQAGARAPDGIAPGQCPARCALSLRDAEALCPALAAEPAGPYPDDCPSFDQLGVRVPLLAVSPFAKPHYVSHVTADHASILALIETRFLPAPGGGHLSLTARDRDASTLEDLFDFDAAPSLGSVIFPAGPPVVDCTP